MPDDVCELCLLAFQSLFYRPWHRPAMPLRFHHRKSCTDGHEHTQRLDTDDPQTYYHLTKDPAFHQGTYALLTAIVLIRSMWVMESQLRPALKARNASKSSHLLKTMWSMVATGMLDMNEICDVTGSDD